jgi:phospholipid/cholesterol/gamma-HCH transport system substrate-binding protein
VKIYLSYRERIAGLFMLFSIIGVVAFLVGAAIQNRWFEPRTAFRTHVVRGEALRSGSPVLLSGLDVGEIGELTILPDNRIEVELLIRNPYERRLRRGTIAEVRRVVGLGEKRVILVSGTESKEPLPSGALIPANEPLDIMDAIANVDLGRYVATLDRVVDAMEVTLKKLEEKDRLERIMETFDQMGPTLKQMNSLLTDLHEPLTSLVGDPNFKGTFEGAAKVFNDRNTRRAMKAVANTFEKERMDLLLAKMDKVMTRFDEMSAKDGTLTAALSSANKALSDKRFDRLLTSMEKLADADKLTKLVDNMSVVAREMAKMGPKIPTLTREMIATMREAVVVLKALQKTWLLEEESKEVRKQSRD